MWWKITAVLGILDFIMFLFIRYLVPRNDWLTGIWLLMLLTTVVAGIVAICVV